MANTRMTRSLLILGSVCALVGAFSIVTGRRAWAVVSLTAALLLLGLLTKRRARESAPPPPGSAGSERMAPEDLSSMTPPAWDAIPPTIGMAAQPDAYFHNRRDGR
ncbi:MAG: hypothetical protein QNJ81_09365 [Acidimicrobiia bacterium]|nr:hypothetical protein [Acidimicrobiia bacterium]